MTSEFMFGVNSDKFSIFNSDKLSIFHILMNLVDRDLTEYQITQTLTLSRLHAQLEQRQGESDCSHTRNMLTGADKGNQTVHTLATC